MKIADAAKALTPAPCRVLLLDIETTPVLSHHWRFHDENIHPEQIVRQSELLCCACKWLGGRGVMFSSRFGKTTDKALAKDIWQVLDKCDLLVAHNGKAFDSKTLNARFAFWGMPPPGPYRVVDTCLLARGMFNFGHNSLDGLARYLGIGHKHPHHGFALWLDCLAGDKSAQRLMERYNVQDVLLLESVYMRLRAYDKRAPNVGIYHEDGVMRCVCCGSSALQSVARMHYLTACGYAVKRCKSCGKLMREAKRAYHAKEGVRNV